MKKITLSAAAVLLAVLTLISAAGCAPNGRPSEEPVRSLIARFEKSCHELDVNGILDCIDPDISGPIRFIAGVAGSFGDQNSEQLFSALSEALSGSKESAEFLSKMTIRTNSVKFNPVGDKAKAEVTLLVQINNEERGCDTDITCVRKNERWYISEFSVPSITDFS